MATTWEDIREAFDAVELVRCPVCHAPTYRDHNGHRRLCLACTELDIGMSAWQNARRIELGWSKARYLAGDDVIPTTPRDARRYGVKGGTPPSPAPARRSSSRKFHGA